MKKSLLLCGGAAWLCGLGCSLVELGITDVRKKKTPDDSKIRVACVGDSITYGNQILFREKYSYPSVLQGLLGDDYQVDNFGLNSRTAQDTGDKPYRKESEYKRSLAFRPNIVILKMGTNDTKTFNWSTGEAFESAYKALLEDYLALDTKPTVYLCTPAAAYPSVLAKGDVYTYSIQNSKLAEARDIVKKVGAEYGLTVIDTAAFTEGHDDWYAWDGIHPNKEAAGKMAHFIYEGMK